MCCRMNTSVLKLFLEQETLFEKFIYAYGVKNMIFFAILKIMCNFANDLTGRTFFNATQMLRLVV